MTRVMSSGELTSTCLHNELGLGVRHIITIHKMRDYKAHDPRANPIKLEEAEE